MSSAGSLAEAFMDLAGAVVDGLDLPLFLDRLLRHGVDLTGADHAGLLLADDRGVLRLAATSSEVGTILELFQLQSDEGPCLEAIATGNPVIADDLATITYEWPNWQRAAVAVGVVSVTAIPMRVHDITIGALNLFSLTPRTTDAEQLTVARALASFATISLLQQRALDTSEQVVGQLQTALQTRIVIEQAKGILSASGEVDVEGAYQALRRFSSHTNTRLAELARQIVDGRLEVSTVLGVPLVPDPPAAVA